MTLKPLCVMPRLKDSSVNAQLILPTVQLGQQHVCLLGQGRTIFFFTLSKQLAVFRISRVQQKKHTVLCSVVQGEQDKAQGHAGLLRSKDVIENGKVMFPARSVSKKSGLNDFK